MKAARRVVVKIGSALLTNDGQGLDKAAIDRWSDGLADLRKRGKEIIIVSSGAVAAGMRRLGWDSRPTALYELQAAAAVGQMGLVQTWESSFQRFGLHTAQVLLTHDDLSDRRRYLNARSTLCTLTSLGVIPIINENDTVAFEELRFGDNDTLAALVANAVSADLLILLTDQSGLFDADPRQKPDATMISEGDADDPSFAAMAGDGGALGRGGMTTKVRAARLAARSGAATVITSGRNDDVVRRILAGESLGTFLKPTDDPIPARKRWLAGQLKPRGKLHLDAGATTALTERGRSLLPVGVTGVDGEFQRGELVVCLAPDGREVARGLVNYNAAEARKIQGIGSDKLAQVLGYVDEPELIHRDNLTLI
ncbi:MAG: glutamate 5-kinase [Chromatiales bacterium]|nr:glutamate 5-kinase [Gammaproteobacteria bacterium]MCP5352941.1 glutamate 5-kinase [Chromatiales bacterium]